MGRTARTNPAQLARLKKEKRSGQGKSIFLDVPFYKTYQVLSPNRYKFSFAMLKFGLDAGRLHITRLNFLQVGIAAASG